MFSSVCLYMVSQMAFHIETFSAMSADMWLNTSMSFHMFSHLFYRDTLSAWKWHLSCMNSQMHLKNIRSSKLFLSMGTAIRLFSVVSSHVIPEIPFRFYYLSANFAFESIYSSMGFDMPFQSIFFREGLFTDLAGELLFSCVNFGMFWQSSFHQIWFTTLWTAVYFSLCSLVKENMMI